MQVLLDDLVVLAEHDLLLVAAERAHQQLLADVPLELPAALQARVGPGLLGAVQQGALAQPLGDLLGVPDRRRWNHGPVVLGEGRRLRGHSLEVGGGGGGGVAKSGASAGTWLACFHSAMPVDHTRVAALTWPAATPAWICWTL